MNVWRWLGLFLFFAALTCFVGTRVPAYAGGKDAKDKKDEKKTDGKDEKKTDGKDGKKDEKKDEKKQETKGGGEPGKFKAFEPDSKPFFQEVKTDTVQTMKVQGQDVTQKQDQTFYIKWTPEKKSGDSYVVKQQVVGVKMNIDIGGNKIAYDSTLPTDKQPKNPMTDFFSALMKQELTFTIGSDMKIAKVDVRTEFIKSLSDTNPAIKTLLDTIMSENALKSMAEPTWWAVPMSDQKTWEKTSKLELGPIGTYVTKFTFTREGANDAKLEKIKIDAKLDYSQPTEKSGLPFTIKEAKLTSDSGTGEALFDPAKGRLESSKLTMKLKGELKIEVGNMATDITLDQTQTSTTRTYDTDPVATKK